MGARDDGIMGQLADMSEYQPGDFPDPPPDTFGQRWNALRQAAPADAFEAAAQRTRAPYRGAIEREGTSNLGPLAEDLAPQEPWQWGLMFATPGASLVGRAVAAVPPAARALAAAGAFALQPSEAEAKPKMGDVLKTLFDYSKVHDVPDVKQFDLPRYDPPRGVSERVQELMKNRSVQNQMLDYIQKGKDINAQTFYYNEPLRQAFVSELGKKEGSPAFQRYMDYVAATSPRSDVETNARNASYYYGLERRGEPVPPQGGVNPQPYGHMAQNLHRENAEKIRSGEYFDVTKNPKPLSFSQNLQGNFDPVTVDAHAFKLPAMLARDPEFIAGSIKLEKGQPTINPSKMLASGDITMEDAFKRPVYWAGKPNANEYGAMEQYYKRLAAEAGMTPAQTQAAAWAGGGKITGLESVAGDPFMRSVENRAIKTAAERGISPAEALSQMMRGKAPLLGTAAGVPLGAGMMGSLADQGNYNQ